MCLTRKLFPFSHPGAVLQFQDYTLLILFFLLQLSLCVFSFYFYVPFSLVRSNHIPSGRHTLPPNPSNTQNTSTRIGIEAHNQISVLAFIVSIVRKTAEKKYSPRRWSSFFLHPYLLLSCNPTPTSEQVVSNRRPSPSHRVLLFLSQVLLLLLRLTAIDSLCFSVAISTYRLELDIVPNAWEYTNFICVGGLSLGQA